MAFETKGPFINIYAPKGEEGGVKRTLHNKSDTFLYEMRTRGEGGGGGGYSFFAYVLNE